MDHDASYADHMDERLNEVIAEYLCALQAGEKPQRQLFLLRYPDLAEPLQAFFADYDAFDWNADPLHTVSPPSKPGAAGQLLGNYELLEEIGSGGMGVVYRARRTDLPRVVALKISRVCSSAAEIARFQTEVEVVASLDHPNIVPVYEVGEHQGQHYFTMKYVQGGSLARRLGKYADDLPRGMRLLEQVARGVHHAHQHGVLHRDLKPANILLTAEGEPLVADFGLARRLQVNDGLTGSAILGTPAYMAPEQAGGKKGLSTAADVYSLGAILYELLTREVPFWSESPYETLRQVQECEPKPPRQLNSKIHRDLETICLKCLQKEPGKRYPSAGELADDLKRFLDGEPIAARPTTGLERAVRWVKKHKAAAAILGLSMLLLLGLFLGLLGFAKLEHDKVALVIAKAETEAQLGREFAARAQAEAEHAREQMTLRRFAESARDRAEANYQVARAAVDEMLTRVAQWRLAHQPHMEKVRRDLLLAASNRYTSLLGYNGHDPSIRWETGRSYVRVGNIRAELGELPEAEKAYHAGQQHLEGLVREFPGNPLYQRDLAACLVNLGSLLKRFNHLDRAADAYQRCAALRQKLDQWHRAITPFERPARLLGGAAFPVNLWGLACSVAAPHDDPSYALDLAAINNNLGILAYSRNQFKEAGEYYRQALETYGRLRTAYPKNERYSYEEALCYDNLGELLAKLGKKKEAERALAEARENLLQLVEAFKPGELIPPEYRQQLARCYDHLANLLVDVNPQRAHRLYQNSLELRIKLVEEFPDMLGYRQEQAASLNNIAIALVGGGDMARANNALEEAVKEQERLVQLAPLDKGFRHDLASTYLNAANLLLQKSLFKDAEKYYLQALQRLNQFLKQFPDEPEYAQNAGTVLRNLSILQINAQQPAQAVESSQRSLEAYQRLAKQWPEVPLYRHELAQSLSHLATVQCVIGRPANAEQPYRRAMMILTELAKRYPNNPNYRFELAMIGNNLAGLLKTPGQYLLNPIDASPLGWTRLPVISAGRRAEAEQAWRSAVEELTQLTKIYSVDAVYQRELAHSLAALAQFLETTPRFAEAEQHWRAALDLLAKLRAKFPDQPLYTLGLAQMFGKRGFAFLMADRWQKAQESLLQAIELVEPLALKNPMVLEYWTELFNDYENLARSLAVHDRLQDVENIRRQMVTLREKQCAALPNTPDMQCNLAGSFNDLAAILRKRNKPAESDEEYRKAIRLLENAPALKTQAGSVALRSAYLGSAETLVLRNRHAETAACIAKLATATSTSQAESLESALLLGQCIELAREDARLSQVQRRHLALSYGEQAVALLRRALAAGSGHAPTIRNDRRFAPLRDRPDFWELLIELELGPKTWSK